mgnify:CR=1 FL=1
MDKIYKFFEYFINEESSYKDAPEDYIKEKLNMLKNKLGRIFDKEDGEPDFKDMNLGDLSVSNYNQMRKYLSLEFNDEKYMYYLSIIIDLKDVQANKIESVDDVDSCYIKFKRYDNNTLEEQGLITRNEKIKNIDADLLIQLKVEIDEQVDGEDSGEEFKIEEVK